MPKGRSRVTEARTTPQVFKVVQGEVSRATFDEIAAVIVSHGDADAHVEDNVLALLGGLTLKVKE